MSRISTLFVFCAAFLCGCHAQLSQGGVVLDREAARLARDISNRAGLSGKQAIVTPHSFYDAANGMSLPLALHLKAAIVRELTALGVTVLAPGPDQADCYRIRGSWMRDKSDLLLSLEAVRVGDKGLETVAASSARIPASEIDPKDLQPDRDSWARFLIRRLEAAYQTARPISINVRAMKIQGGKADAELGRYLAEWLCGALVESSSLRPLDQQTAMGGIPITELRTRGIAPKAKSGEELSLTGDLLKADAELRGEVWIQPEKGMLELRIRVVDRAGRQLTAASADMPASHFPPELLRPAKVQEGPPRDGISKKGLLAEISTTRGEILFCKGK